ncbi:restriction endonuclease, partial [Lacticaseibacillus paracasei]
HLLVVDWQDDGIRIRNFTDSSGKIRSHNYNLEYIFKKGITWNALTSGNFSARLSEPGFLFDNAGSKMFFNEEEHITYFLALLSTPVVHYVLSVMNPTLNFQPGSLANLPIILINKPLIKKLSEENISLTRQYWNQFEYSWDFVFPFKFQNIAEHQKSPTTKLLIFFDFCDKYVPIQFRGLIFYGKLSKKR